MRKIKILIVEDEIIVAKDIAYYLEELGCEVVDILMEGEAAVEYMLKNQADIILMDIMLKGNLDGIQTVQLIKEHRDIPIIFLTANTDDRSFQLAKTTKPYGFIEKPFKPKRLVRTVELLIEQIVENYSTEEIDSDNQFVLSDRIFVRDNGKMKKIFLDEIKYIEADGSYCNIITKTKKHLITANLLKIEEKISSSFFMRVHRSYIINLNHIDGIQDSYVEMEDCTIPISRKYINAFMNKVNVI